MKKILERAVPVLIFLMPWQTVWIIKERMIGPAGAVGVWQYGTEKIYAIECFILLLAILSFICFFVGIWRHTEPSFFSRIGQWKRSRFFFFDCAVFGFLFFAALSILWSSDRTVASFAFIRLCEGAFLLFLFRSTRLRFSEVARAWIAGAVIQSIFAMAQFGMQTISANTLLGIAAQNPASLGVSVVEAGDRRWLRAYGAFSHPNVLGAYFTISMLWCGMALSRIKEKWLSVIALLSSQIILVGLLLSFSRGALIALLAAAVVSGGVSWWARRKNRHKLDHTISPSAVFVLISLVTIAVFSSYFFDEVKTRVGIERSRLESQSIDERIASIPRALPLIKTVWYRGTGIGTFTRSLFNYEQEHSTVQPWYTYQPLHTVFLMIFVELGILGIVFFLAAAYFFFRPTVAHWYPFIVSLFIFSSVDHFLWTLPFGVFFSCIVLGLSCRKQLSGIDRGDDFL